MRPHKNTIKEDRFAGCLIGQCLADSLGAVVEGRPAYECRAYVNNVLNGDMPRRTRPGYSLGQYTDDSQLARALFESYVACETFEPQDYANRIRDLFATRRIVGPGRTTTDAAMHLMSGLPWDQAAAAPNGLNAGNGSAMRAAPVGLFFRHDMDQLVQATIDQGRITHADPTCSAGALAIAGATALVINDVEDVDRIIDELAALVEPLDQPTADGIRNLHHWLKLPPHDAVYEVAALSPIVEKRWMYISPFVRTSVVWALYSFLRAPDDYWETICTAIGCGGDVDTTAAMAGAISGAYLGLSEITTDYVRDVNDRGRWGYSQLVELAKNAASVHDGHTATSFIDSGLRPTTIQ
jgi:ADP-ribosylglycohydrolase